MQTLNKEGLMKYHAGIKSMIDKKSDVNHSHNKDDISGLDKVENKSSAEIRSEITEANVTLALGYTPIDSSSKGMANGIATLGEDGKVPSSQLPLISGTITGVTMNGKVMGTEGNVDLGTVVTDVSDKADTDHKHTKSDITDFPTSLPASDVSAWAKASSKPSYTASEVGAAASSHTHDDRYYTESEIDSKLNGKLNTSLKGVASGLAELDSAGKVPSSQLPSYVDDVVEYDTKSKFPTTGESGKIYIDKSTNITWRWGGSSYVEISPSLALGETSSTAYRGDKGKVAYDHSQAAHARTDATKVESSSTNGNIKINGTETTVYTHPSGTNPHGTTKSDVGLGNVGNFKAVSTVASQGLSNTEKSNARANIGAGTSSFSGSYNDLSNKPTIPTNNNQLTNGAGYITSSGTAKTISDTLPISKGGTGQTTGENAANALINSLSESDGTPSDNDYYISQYAGGGTTHKTYYRRPVSALWNYTKSKLATVATSGSYNDLSNKPTSLPASDVSAWAKASSKPSYSWSEITSKPSKFTPDSHTHDDRYYTESEIDTKLAGKAATSHGNHVPATQTANNAVFLRNDNSWQTITPANIGAAASSHTHDDRYYTESEINTKLNGKLNTSLKGVASGLAELDSSGKVPSSQLPSYVDDVLEYDTKSKFPTTGEPSKIYIDKSTNITWRWGGSSYVEISPSLALGETSSTAYRGDRGKAAYDHSQAAHAPSNAQANVQSDWNATSGDAFIKNKPTSLPASDVYAWAKASSKPSYSWSEITSKPSKFTPDSHTHDDRYYTESEIDTKLAGKAASSHGNHVPATQTANNAVFLRNDNSWQTVTPANIGAAASSHTHNYAGSSSAGGSANSLAGFTNTTTTATAVNNATQNGHVYVSDTSGIISQSDGACYVQAYSTSWVHQIYGDYRTGQIAVRGKNNGTWQEWRKVLDSSNYKTYCTPANIGAAASSHTHDNRYYTESEIDTKLAGKAEKSHGNHVPATQTANNAVFLRNDNSWQTVTPANIGAAASSHTHSYLPLSGGEITGSIITPKNDNMGIIPNTNNYGQIGSSDKKFYRMYATTFYGALSGNASTATALTTSAGSATQPIYFSDGKPVACSYTLGKSVPSNAVFTDTNTWRGIQDNLTSTSTTDSLSAKQGKVLNDKFGTTLTSTLSAGSTTLTFSNSVITTSSTIDLYTDKYGVNPTNVVVEAGKMTLTFDAQSSAISVKAIIK